MGLPVGVCQEIYFLLRAVVRGAGQGDQQALVLGERLILVGADVLQRDSSVLFSAYAN